MNKGFGYGMEVKLLQYRPSLPEVCVLVIHFLVSFFELNLLLKSMSVLRDLKARDERI